MIKSASIPPWLRSGVRIAVTVGLLYIILQMTNPAEILSALKKANIWYIFAAFLLLLFNLGFQFLKWDYLLARTGKRLPRSEVLASFFFGLTLGSFTPGQIGELGGRALNLKSEEPGTVIGLTIFDKFQVFAVMFVGGIFSIITLLGIGSSFVTSLGLIAVAVAAVLLISPRLLRIFLEAIGISRLKYRWAAKLVESMGLISVRDAVVTALLTLLFYATVYGQMLLLFTAFSPVGPLQVFLGYSGMMLVKSLLPISIADLGTREIGLVYFMSLQGIAKAISFDASILLFTINILLPAICGLMFLPDRFSHSRSLPDD